MKTMNAPAKWVFLNDFHNAVGARDVSHQRFFVEGRINSLLAVAIAACMVWLVNTAQDAFGATYPQKSIRMLVGFSAGGGPDIVARLAGPRLAEVLGQQIVIDNRPGAGGTIAEEIVVRAPADGYTVLLCASSLSINPSLYRNLSYDASRELAAVSLLGVSAQVLIVLPSFKAKSVRELIALAKAKPGQLSFASSGNGAGSHLAGELFKLMAGVDLIHVPYKGSGPGITAVISGETSLMIAPVASAIPHVKAGRVNALAVTTAKRSGAAPEIPTMSEAGLSGYEAYPWYGILVPAATPASVVTVLHAAATKILSSTDLRDRMLGLGVDPVGNSPAEFARFVKVESERWARVIRSANLKVN